MDAAKDIFTFVLYFRLSFGTSRRVLFAQCIVSGSRSPSLACVIRVVAVFVALWAAFFALAFFFLVQMIYSPPNARQGPPESHFPFGCRGCLFLAD